MNKGIFITGTNTGVGKTVTSAILLAAMKKHGTQVGYFKPVQTGTDEDTPTVANLAGLTPNEIIAPAYHFPEPIAPSRAAALHGTEITLGTIAERFQSLDPNTFWIVEGAGGLLVPLNSKHTIRDLARTLELPLVIVASTQLGTMNHTFLTVEAARSAGLAIAGIVLVGDTDPGLETALTEYLSTQDGGAIPILLRIPRFPTYVPLPTPGALENRDRKVIWHPYSQHGLEENTPAILSAQGSSFTLGDGRVVIDGTSSWWVNLHGHAEPTIATAIAEQAAKMEHVIFAGFTHEPAIELAELLTTHPAIQHAELSRVFYSDNGSTAIEAALKMAYQYHFNLNPSKIRGRFLALSDSYHGDTLGAMAVCEPEGFHKTFRPLMPRVDFVRPGDLEQLKQTLREHGENYAAFIFEPLVQGAAGMKMYSAKYLRDAVALCQEYGVLTICDEIFTGFFRTGKCFAFEHAGAGLKPDMVCLSKGITGGFLPLSCTLTTERIFEAFLSKDVRTAFLHGHSYTGNPIVCAAAIASWKLLHSSDCQVRIARIVRQTADELRAFEGHPRVKEARHLGTIGVIETNLQGTYYSGHLKRLCREALDHGVFLRPLGDVLYVLPPYCITEAELRKVYSVIAQLL